MKMPLAGSPAARRSAWIAAIATAILLCGMLLSSLSRQPDATPPPAALETRSVVPQSPEPLESTVADVEASAATPEVSHVNEVQLCGGEWLPIGADGSPAPADVERVMNVPETLQRLMQNLRAQGSPRSLAAALLLESADQVAKRVAERAENCEGAGCGALLFDPSFTVNPATDELARMATLSSDPQMYAWALSACGGPSLTHAGPCSLLNIEQWVRLDPNNATPWLAALNAATQRHDDAAAAEALHRIATAKRDNVRGNSFVAPVLDHGGIEDADLPATWALLASVSGLQAARMPSWLPLSKMCSGAALKDSNRQQECAASAEVLAERSDNLMARAIGISIGGRVGWADDRVDRMRGEYLAYVDSLVSELKESDFSAASVLGCKAMQKQLDQMRSVARVGETGVMRDWVAKSGQQADDFIVRGQRERKRIEAATVAASAAKAPSSAR